ncbi:MAG: hypothetical protein M3017_12805 [Actinomycetota bacterium]|nr:hypothetical protein [Actinomycetota bacterium]
MNNNAMPAPIRLQIAAVDPLAAEEQLNAALSELQRLATAERRRGIMVTRTGPGCYTAALSDRVPYGVTQEDPHEP